MPTARAIDTNNGDTCMLRRAVVNRSADDLLLLKKAFCASSADNPQTSRQQLWLALETDRHCFGVPAM
jgi:hypothetical protein